MVEGKARWPRLMLSHYGDERKAKWQGDVGGSVDGEKQDESERIGGIVSRRARPLQWNALTGSDPPFQPSYGMDLEAAPSASSDPRLSIRHAFLAARRTKRSRNWLQPRYECPPSPSTPVHRGTPRFVRAFPISSLRQRFFPKFIHLYIYTRILSRSRYGSR